MNGIRAIFRIELRLLRRELILGAVATAALVLWRYAGPEPVEGAPGLGPIGLGATLLALFVVCAGREWALAGSWHTLAGPLPVPNAQVPLARAVLWSGLALPFATVFTLFVAAAPGPASASHVLTLWLWLVLAGATCVAGDLRRQHTERGTTLALATTARLIALLVTLPSALGVADPLLSGWPTAWLLAVLPAATLLHIVWIDPEWMPSQSPKTVRPRSGMIGDLIRSGPKVPSVRRVFAHLGVRRIDLWALATALYLAIYMRDVRGQPSFEGSHADHMRWAIAYTAVAGAAVTIRLRSANRRWAFLRAYPVRAWRVWAWPMVGIAAGLIVGLVLAANAAFAERPRISDSTIYDYHRYDGGGAPELLAPTWARTERATSARPEEMPRPDRWGYWSMRSSSQPIENETAYFKNALRYYMRLVHALHLTHAELSEALGEPFVLTPKTRAMPVEVYREHVISPGALLTSLAAEPEARYVEVHLPSWRGQRDQIRRSYIYSYVAALDRLERRLGDRLAETAHLRFPLEVAVLLLALLLFVRLALLRGPMQWAAPCLPLLAVGLWYGTRTSPWHMAVRDAHLGAPVISGLVALALALLLMRSIRRNLRMSAPGPVSW